METLLGDEEYMEASLSHRPLDFEERAHALLGVTERDWPSAASDLDGPERDAAAVLAARGAA